MSENDGMSKNDGGKFAQAVHAIVNRANKIFVRSAANPILWLCAGTVPVCFLAAYWFRGYPWIMYPLVYLGMAVVICALYNILFLLHTDPNKLQSETFQLQHEEQLLKRLQIIKAPGASGVVDPISIPIIANPVKGELAAAAAAEEAES